MKSGTDPHRDSPTRISQSSEEIGSAETDLATERFFTIPISIYAGYCEYLAVTCGESTYSVTLDEPKTNGKLRIDFNRVQWSIFTSWLSPARSRSRRRQPGPTQVGGLEAISLLSIGQINGDGLRSLGSVV